MMSLEQIQALSHKAALKAARAGTRPFIVEEGDAERFLAQGKFPFPFIGEYVPKGWKLVETYFADATGMGYDNEPALTMGALARKLKVGKGYAVVEAGEFQVYVGEFEQTRRGA